MFSNLEFVMWFVFVVVFGSVIGFECECLLWVVGLCMYMLVCVGLILIMIVLVFGFVDVFGISDYVVFDLLWIVV